MVAGVFAMFVAGVPSAEAASTGQLTGQITITGTGGKDAFVVTFGNGTADGTPMTVSPAATVTAASGTCSPNTDPLTGRPTFNECLLANEQHTLVPDLL